MHIVKGYHEGTVLFSGDLNQNYLTQKPYSKTSYLIKDHLAIESVAISSQGMI